MWLSCTRSLNDSGVFPIRHTERQSSFADHSWTIYFSLGSFSLSEHITMQTALGFRLALLEGLYNSLRKVTQVWEWVPRVCCPAAILPMTSQCEIALNIIYFVITYCYVWVVFINVFSQFTSESFFFSHFVPYTKHCYRWNLHKSFFYQLFES